MFGERVVKCLDCDLPISCTGFWPIDYRHLMMHFRVMHPGMELVFPE